MYCDTLRLEHHDLSVSQSQHSPEANKTLPQNILHTNWQTSRLAKERTADLHNERSVQKDTA